MATSSQPHPTVLLLDLPPKTFVGINLASFNSSPNFHGITNLPAGLHFLYTGTDASLSIRHGHWLYIQSRSLKTQIYVLRWSHEQESLELLDATDSVTINAVHSIPSLRGRGLVEYAALRDASSTLQSKQTAQQHNGTTDLPHEDTADDDETSEPDQEDPWPKLISYISPTTISRILTSTSQPTDPTSQHNHPWTISSISTGSQDTESIPGLSATEASEVLHSSRAASQPLSFVHVDLKRTWPSSALGRDRTDKALDKSWYLGHLIDSLVSSSPSRGTDANDNDGRQTGARELVAELQFCFVMVLTLANYSCLEQWKRVLGVLFGCRAAVGEVEGYFVKVVKVVRTQLGRVEDVDGGLFEMGDEMGSAWLRGLLGGFSAGVDEIFSSTEGGRGALREELGRLEAWLEETYGWADRGTLLKRGMVDLEDGERVEVQMDGFDEEEELGEYAPVVVEM